MVLAHFLALVFSAWLIARAELLIDRVLAVAAFVRRALVERSPRRRPRPGVVHVPPWRPPAPVARSLNGSRAPPAAASI
jgi:hypothetical protein